MWGAQPASGKIVSLDPATGEVLHEFWAPDDLQPGHTQVGLTIAEGGDALVYVNSHVDPSKLYRLDPITGAVLSVESTDGLTYDGLGFQSAPRVLSTIYSANMDTDPGWTLDGGWQFGVPTGGGSGTGDPTAGFTGSNVIGYDLQGDYPNDMSAEYATTPAIDASQYRHVHLSFYRWLGVADSWSDEASVEVSNDGANWITVWTHGWTWVADTEWVFQSFDISSVADGESTVYVRWGMGPTDESLTYPGWNVDDVTLTGSAGRTARRFSVPRGRRGPSPGRLLRQHRRSPDVVRPIGRLGWRRRRAAVCLRSRQRDRRVRRPNPRDRGEHNPSTRD